jgi:exopolysaccharide production protein ExoZ
VSSNEAEGLSKNPLYSIQILRAFAALMVAFAHFYIEFIQVPGGFSIGIFTFGVDLFFVISGFIMLHISWEEFGEPGASRYFIIRRLARIAPIYWLMTAVMLGLIIYTQPLEQADLSIPSIIGSFLFLPIPRPNGFSIPVLTVGWTLNLEIAFYFLFAVALFMRRSFGTLFISLILLAVVFLCFQGVFANMVGPEYWASPIILEFVFGLLLAMAYHRKVSIPLPLAACLVAAGALIVWNFEPRETYYTRPLIAGGAAVLIVVGAVFGKWGSLRS